MAPDGGLVEAPAGTTCAVPSDKSGGMFPEGYCSVRCKTLAVAVKAKWWLILQESEGEVALPRPS